MALNTFLPQCMNGNIIYGALNEAISLAANGLMRSTQMRNFFLENYLLFAGCRCLL